VEANKAWHMKPLQDNALRFDTFALKLNGSGEPTNLSGSNVQVKTFIYQCADLADQQRLPLSFHQVFGTPMKMAVHYPVACTYENVFEVETLPGSCSLLMDKEAISGEYQIWINDQAVQDFKDQFVYDHRNQISNITAMLQKGQNTLRIEVTVQHDFDGIVDALYLLGDFGITFKPDACPMITTTDHMSAIHSGPYPTLPFYSGTTLFKRTENLERVPQSERFILTLSDLDKNVHDCLEVVVNGSSLGVRAWTPYQWEGPASILKEGENEIEVKVTNTLIGLLEGKSFDYDTHTLKDVKDASMES
jgi:hypothetical protein